MSNCNSDGHIYILKSEYDRLTAAQRENEELRKEIDTAYDIINGKKELGSSRVFIALKEQNAALTKQLNENGKLWIEETELLRKERDELLEELVQTRKERGHNVDAVTEIQRRYDSELATLRSLALELRDALEKIYNEGKTRSGLSNEARIAADALAKANDILKDGAE